MTTKLGCHRKGLSSRFVSSTTGMAKTDDTTSYLISSHPISLNLDRDVWRIHPNQEASHDHSQSTISLFWPCLKRTSSLFAYLAGDSTGL